MADDRDIEGILTGIEVIDRAHRELIQVIRAAERAPEDGRLDPIQTYRTLQRHVLIHFQEEEQAMAAVEFPELEAHRAEHKKLADLMTDISIEFVEHGTQPTTLARANQVLGEWMLRHIMEIDAKFAEFLRRERKRRRTTGPPVAN